MDLSYFENHGKSRKRMRSNFEDDPPTGLEHLPYEIVNDILSRLPISSLLQFKSVCRTWRALAQDPHLVNFYLSTKTKDPCLILHCDFPIRNQLYFVDFATLPDQGKKKLKRINIPFWPMMPEFDVVGSCNGLLCLSDSLYNDAVYVYNPFTRNHVELPKSYKYPEQQVVFGFGFHPKTQKYKVIKIIYYRYGHGSYPRARRLGYPKSEVRILTLGSSRWRTLGKIPFQLVRRHSEALVNGRLHWISQYRRCDPSRLLVSLDLADERFREVPKPDYISLSKFNYHLVVLRGCLSAAVHCSYARLEIWVMKEYNVKESWVKEYNIGHYLPKGLKQNLDRPPKIWKNALNGRLVRVLGLLQNGEFLLEYKSRVLVTHDPKLGNFKDLTFQGIPKWFQTVVLVGSLGWINTTLHT